MSNPIVHVELVSADPDRLEAFYGAVFGWEFQDRFAQASSAGINANLDEGDPSEQRITLYAAVDDVEAALVRAEEAGAERVLGPHVVAPGELVVGRFRDPLGNLIGVAGPQ
ncbi:hypothetical protein BJF85_23960 [Saccharomonospora sp. CUA-673]|uniref:VOC family protein n=1 Tax=Saccharomonospora sp. CUA-673 TaxID=1904969 RepID=UPI00095BEA21|nr:VOC family protein [Saccharomonospora sp. CUA-673]OLT41341.1 hypothetical protein BJF85_23960 [Saccharomonospora sp. CUA-673]